MSAPLNTEELAQKGRDDFAAGIDRREGAKDIPAWRLSSWIRGWDEAKADADAKAAGKVAMPSDFPTAEVQSSYSGVSHSGASRARSDREEFVAKVQSLYDEAKALVETNAQRVALDEAIKIYKDEYLAQTRSLAKVYSGTYSGYVAGRANINTKQVDSRNSALSRAIERFIAWDKAAAPKVKDAVLAVRTPEKIAQLQAEEAARKLEQHERRQRRDMDLMAQILEFKAGDSLKIGAMLVTNVSKDKEGYPLTLTIKAQDGTPLMNDKLNLAKEVFGKRGAEGLRAGKEKIRALVEAVLAERAAKGLADLQEMEAADGASGGAVMDAQAAELRRVLQCIDAGADPYPVLDEQGPRDQVATAQAPGAMQ
jgi:hypothetical protein